MINALRSLSYALLFAAIAACSGAKSNGQPPSSAQAATLPAAPAKEDARALVAAGAPVIDVRTQEEWTDGHLDVSTLIPVQEFDRRTSEVDALVGGDKDKAVVVVCRSGNRAAMAKTKLEALGYTHVVNAGRWENLK